MALLANSSSRKQAEISSPTISLKKILGMWQLYLLLSPALIYFIIFNYVPMYGVIIAFKDYVPTASIIGSKWVGLKHFELFINSYHFWILIKNTVLISLYSLIFGFPLPIILALMLNEMRTGFYKKFIQTVTYAPHFISMVVIVSMMILFLSPDAGIINKFMGLFGTEPINFMGKASLFRLIYVASGIWQETGWASILFLAALAGIDYELHEAAIIDGANRLQRIWFINLPGIMPTIIIVLIFSVSGLMNVGFEKVYLMQNAMNLSVSEVISTYVYKRGIQNAQYSFSTAVGLFNSAINFVLLLIVNGMSRRFSETSLW
jgi:putative aldouronate transport system permease protein